jgi:hypothetical protein
MTIKRPTSRGPKKGVRDGAVKDMANEVFTI